MSVAERPRVARAVAGPAHWLSQWVDGANAPRAFSYSAVATFSHSLDASPLGALVAARDGALAPSADLFSMGPPPRPCSALLRASADRFDSGPPPTPEGLGRKRATRRDAEVSGATAFAALRAGD